MFKRIRYFTVIILLLSIFKVSSYGDAGYNNTEISNFGAGVESAAGNPGFLIHYDRGEISLVSLLCSAELSFRPEEENLYFKPGFCAGFIVFFAEFGAILPIDQNKGDNGFYTGLKLLIPVDDYSETYLRIGSGGNFYVDEKDEFYISLQLSFASTFF